jgi:hypothetical protein
VEVSIPLFTVEEFEDILDVNSDNDAILQNGEQVKAGDLMEAFYELFVRQPEESKQVKKAKK